MTWRQFGEVLLGKWNGLRRLLFSEDREGLFEDCRPDDGDRIVLVSPVQGDNNNGWISKKSPRQTTAASGPVRGANGWIGCRFVGVALCLLSVLSISVSLTRYRRLESRCPDIAIFSSSAFGAAFRAVSRSMRFCRKRRINTWLKDSQPNSLSAAIAAAIRWSSRSRMAFLMIGVMNIISTAGTRGMSLRDDLRSFWFITARRLNAILVRKASCLSSGNRSRIRPMVCAQPDE